MLNDSHIHIGQFREIYTSPNELVKFLDSVGVDNFAVSSTTIWEENYNKVIKEISELIQLAGARVFPILWISPLMLKNGGLNIFLQSGITWKCVKVHGVHPWEKQELNQCVNIARQLNVPLLFHTGGFEQCEAGVYLPIIRNNPDVVFILAHARPINQAIEVMRQCPNAWADTAFTPKDGIAQLIQHGFANRVMFGTDYPLHNLYYKGQDIYQIYQQTIADTKSVMSEEEWNLVSHNNFEYLFSKINSKSNKANLLNPPKETLQNII